MLTKLGPKDGTEKIGPTRVCVLAAIHPGQAPVKLEALRPTGPDGLPVSLCAPERIRSRRRPAQNVSRSLVRSGSKNEHPKFSRRTIFTIPEKSTRTVAKPASL